MTLDDIKALAAQHGGLRSSGRDPRTATIKQPIYPSDPTLGMQDVENPNPTYIYTFGDDSTMHVVGERDDAGTATGNFIQIEGGTLKPSARGTAPTVIASGTPSGTIVWDEQGGPQGTGGYGTVPGSVPNAPREPVSSANGEFWQMGADGYMHMVGSSPSALEDRRIAAAAAQATAARAEDANRRAELEQRMKAIELAQKAGEIDDKRAQELRDYLYKTEVEAPQKLREQEDVLKGNALTYGQTAGTQAVSDVTSMLPYRYSPGFMERRQQGIEAIGRGDYRPQTIARGYTGPDLTGTRQQAQGAAQGQYLNAFGFDPMPIANQIAYRPPVAPQPGAVAPQAPSGDDEEFLKRIARELAGTGGNQ